VVEDFSRRSQGEGLIAKTGTQKNNGDQLQFHYSGQDGEKKDQKNIRLNTAPGVSMGNIHDVLHKKRIRRAKPTLSV